jgi:predicted small integral membrane protein
MKFCLSVIVLLAASSISIYAQKVTVDYDTNLDFKKYKTYAWLAPGDSVLNRYRSEKLYGGYLAYAANNELRNKGMKMDTLNPDAIFVYDTRVNDVEEYHVSPTLSVGVGVAGPGYYVGGMAPVAGGKVTVTTSEKGILTYAMYDTQTKNLVWSARGEQKFKMSQDVQKIIGDATKKMFKTLPIKKK